MSNQLQELQEQINAFWRDVTSMDLPEMSDLAHEIQHKLRGIYDACREIDDNHNLRIAVQLLVEFSSSYEHHVASPAIQRQIENYKSHVLRRYGQKIREPYDTNLGCVHIHERGAIKISRKDYTPSAGVIDDPVCEAKWYRAVSKDGNPTMLPCLEAFPLGDCYVSVTHRATQGNLLDYTNSHLWRPDVAKKMFLNLLQGVAVLHNGYRVAHLDLKLENIFLDENDRVIIGDFGYALPVRSVEPNETRQSQEQQLQQRLEQAGAAAADIKRKIEDFNKKFYDVYERFDQQYQTISSIIRASHRDVDSLLNRLHGVKVPLAWIFRPSYQRLGFNMDSIHSIDGYSDPNDPHMSGEKLVNSFLAHLRQRFPDEHAQKRELTLYTARLMPNLDPELYRIACKPDVVVPPVTIDEPRGTIKYMCPSLRARLPTDPFAADIYSLGVMLFCIAAHFTPYDAKFSEDFDTNRAFLELQRGGVGHLLRCYNRPNVVTPECLALLEKMMSFDPAARPTIDKCIELFKFVEFLPRG